MTLSSTKNKQYLPQSEMRNEDIDVTNTMHSPQGWSRRPHPVLSFPRGSEQIHRNAVLLMRLDVAIETTQIGQNIMRIAVVMLAQRTLLGIINLHHHSAPPVLAFQVVGQIKRTKTLILCREPANITQQL